MARQASRTAAASATGKDSNERIIESARRLFQQQGYDGTSITQIAKAAEMAPANLYWYFKSKQEILRAVLLPMYESSFLALEAAVTKDAPPITRLAETVREFVRDQLEATAEDTNFGYLSLSTSLADQAKEELKSHQRSYLSFIEQILYEGASEGSFVVADVPVAAQALTTMCEYVFLWYRKNGRLSADDVATVYVGLALSMVQADETRRPAGAHSS